MASSHEIAGKWEKPSFGPPMPEGGESGPDMAGMPPMDEMPSMEVMPPMPEPKFYFTPDYDEGGKLIPIGTEVLTPTHGCIIGRDATDLGGLMNTPAPTVNNGVWVKLEGSTWQPKGQNYLTRLEVDGTSKILGTVLVDGTPVVPEPGRVYTGRIIVTA